jgi:ATP-binding cassette subfamily C protein LapB
VATRFWSSLALYATSSVQQVVGLLVTVLGVFLVADGAMTIGGLIAANLLAGRMLAPLGGIALTVARAQQALSALAAIEALMRLPADRSRTIGSGARVEHGSVELRQVAFTYPAAQSPALQGVSLKIGAGERVGIIGRIGSGKSTIGRLLAGLHMADSGSILIDEREIHTFEMPEVRRGVAYVSQDAVLFSGTVRDNLIMGAPGATEAELEAVVRMSGVDRFTAHHPRGLLLEVGERGAALSGGQRQAVALARALLRRPRILFLDEPSGAMDADTEAALIAGLERSLGAGVTLLLSTHRMAMLSLVERLVVLDGGRIVADGRKADVLARLSSGGARAKPAIVAP